MSVQGVSSLELMLKQIKATTDFKAHFDTAREECNYYLASMKKAESSLTNYKKISPSVAIILLTLWNKFIFPNMQDRLVHFTSKAHARSRFLVFVVMLTSRKSTTL